MRDRDTTDLRGRPLGPVKWLLSRTLLLHLRSIALYRLFGSRLGGVDWMAARGACEETAGDALWFDYLADSGDSQLSTYRAACLALSDIGIDRATNALTLNPTPRAAGDVLRRGQFLVVGGDTSYPVADAPTLAARFQTPFQWAAKDLADQWGAVEDLAAKRTARVYAVPGNHDYYDGLHGFNRQFRAPARDGVGADGPYLSLPGFVREQQASYFAIELPFGWVMLGLDAQRGRCDFRQRAFFQDVLAKRGRARIILATPEPTTVFGQYTRPAAPIVETLSALGLPTPLRDAPWPLQDGAVRLDLSGDIHHYARYWGPPARGKAPHRSNYASVVSGLGGAFLHPTQTHFEEVDPAVLYPEPRDVRERTAARLLGAWHLMLAGNVSLVGALFAAIVFAASRTGGSDALLRGLVDGLDRPASGHTPGEVWAIGEASAACAAAVGSVGCVAAALVWLGLMRQNKAAATSGRTLTALALLLPAVIGPWVPYDTPGRVTMAPSLLVFAYAVSGCAVLFTAAVHAEFVADRAHGRALPPVDGLVGVGLFVAGIAILAVGLVHYGRVSAADLAVHLAFATVAVLALVGMSLLAALVGGARHSVRGKMGFAALGLWHGVLQVGVPLLWLYRGQAAWVLAYAPAVVAAGLLGYLAARRSGRVWAWVLTLVWLALGAAALWLPLASGGTAAPAGVGWSRAALAVGLAVPLSCVWLGWYLVVALAFNGHNNEAGVGARIDEYAAIVRIRLSQDRLEAYVIAARPDGSRVPGAELVDHFVLEPTGGGKG